MGAHGSDGTQMNCDHIPENLAHVCDDIILLFQSTIMDVTKRVTAVIIVRE